MPVTPNFFFFSVTDGDFWYTKIILHIRSFESNFTFVSFVVFWLLACKYYFCLFLLLSFADGEVTSTTDLGDRGGSLFFADREVYKFLYHYSKKFFVQKKSKK